MTNLQQVLSAYCSEFKTTTVINVLRTDFGSFDFHYEMGKLTHKDWCCRKYSFTSIEEAKEFVETHLDELLEIPF